MTPTSGGSAARTSAVRTFLIADIRGYTRFTNELGDEAVGRLAAKFAQVTAEGVEAWGGNLIELRGDEALCVFESPRAALRCAVELQDAYFDESRLDPYLPLTVGIGLDAGEAVQVGEGYRGSALNLAARLCSAAAAGEVIATEGIVHLAGRVAGLSYAALDGKPLKGFAGRVSAWMISAEHRHDHDSELNGAPRPANLPAELDSIVPLVGREADLRWLGWHWRRARHGHGGIVAISGPPGMGRTRLAAEMGALAFGQGAEVCYTGRDIEPDALAGPALVVVDDLDQVPTARVDSLFERLAAAESHRLVIITHRDPFPDVLAPQLDRHVAANRRRRLRSLNEDAVAAIARLYLEHPGDDPPAQLLLGESRGIPIAVHRVASQWARAAAARHLGDSARRTSRERRDLRAAEADMIDDVARLELARERSRVFVELDESVTDESAPPLVAICPYKGLAAFEASDVSYYFGRERLVAELIARMVGSAFIGLIGASGSGKSSALQAGLLPALTGGMLPGSDQWIQVSMRPGEHPMRQFHAALARSLPIGPGRDANPRRILDTTLESMAPAQRTLIVIDQFEEVFTSVSDEVERATFIDFITQSRAGLKVLVAVRADHYERCAGYPRLARLLGTDQVLVGPLAADEIAAIIRHPAERVGLRVDGGLLDALVADVGVEPGALPLLSTALLELWQARDAGRLTLAAYRATGGVRGAVARLAEAAWERLDEHEQLIARAVFLRLAGDGEGGAVVRRRVRLEELDIDDNRDVATVLGELTSARLLTASDGYIEVAHEALLREWPRLRAWIEEEGAGRELRLHLMGAARTWEEGGREDGDLYRGARLASTLDWSVEHTAELNAGERAFIDASRMAFERNVERQRRTNRNLRALLAGVAVFLVLAIGAGAVAFLQSARAQARELAAAAIAVLDEDPELSILLALEAAEIGGEPTPEAVTALHRAVQASRSLLTLPVTYEEDVRPINVGLAISPDGRRLFVQSASRSVRIHDAQSGDLLTTLGDDRADAQPHHLGLGLSLDGRQLATVDEGGTLRIWTLNGDHSAADSTQEMRTGGLGTLRTPAFSADGTRVATVTFASSARVFQELVLQVWDIESERELRRWDLAWPADVRFDVDGSRLLVPACECAASGPVAWYDIDTGDTEELFTGAFTSATVSPDGSLIATGGGDRVGNIWDADSGEHLQRLDGHRDVLGDVAFSPDGTRLATTGSEGEVRIWDVGTGDLELVLAGHVGLPWGVAWTADGTRVVTGSAQSNVKVWDVTAVRAGEVTGYDFGWERVMNIERAGDEFAALGRGCLVGYCAGEVVDFDLDDGPQFEFPDQGGVGVGIAPDGSGLWMQRSNDDDTIGSIGLYAPDAEDPMITLAGICERSFADESECGSPPVAPWHEQASRFAPSPDGSLLALLGNSGSVSLWETGAGELVTVIPERWFGPDVLFSGFGVEFSPDGTILALGTAVDVFLFDVAGLRELDLQTMNALDRQLQEALEGGRTDPTATSASPHPIAVRLHEMLPVVARLPVGNAWRIEFAPDGSHVAVASPIDNTRVFATEGWTELHELRPSWDLDITPDGQRLATFDADGIVRLWDLRTGELQQAVPVVNVGIGALEGSLRFAPNGQHVLVSDAGSVMIHTTDVDELIEIARTRLTRELSDEECQRFLPDRCGAGAEDEARQEE